MIAGLALLFVAVANVRGLSAERLGTVLRLSLWSIVLLLVVTLIAFVQFFDAAAIIDSVELGDAARLGRRDLRHGDRHGRRDRGRGRLGARRRGAGRPAGAAGAS